MSVCLCIHIQYLRITINDNFTFKIFYIKSYRNWLLHWPCTNIWHRTKFKFKLWSHNIQDARAFPKHFPHVTEWRFGVADAFTRICLLWEYLKSSVYTNRLQTLKDLKRNIHKKTANISINMLERVRRNSRIRFNQYIKNDF